MKLKIVSDGTNIGTRVVNAETGEELDKVVSIQLFFNCESVPSAIIEFLEPEVDVIINDKDTDDDNYLSYDQLFGGE